MRTDPMNIPCTLSREPAPPLVAVATGGILLSSALSNNIVINNNIPTRGHLWPLFFLPHSLPVLRSPSTSSWAEQREPFANFISPFPSTNRTFICEPFCSAATTTTLRPCDNYYYYPRVILFTRPSSDGGRSFLGWSGKDLKQAAVLVCVPDPLN